LIPDSGEWWEVVSETVISETVVSETVISETVISGVWFVAKWNWGEKVAIGVFFRIPSAEG